MHIDGPLHVNFQSISQYHFIIIFFQNANQYVWHMVNTNNND